MKLQLKKARYSRAGKRLEFHLHQVQNQTKLNNIYFRTQISVVKLEGKQGNCKQLSTWQSPLGKAEEKSGAITGECRGRLRHWNVLFPNYGGHAIFNLLYIRRGRCVSTSVYRTHFTIKTCKSNRENLIKWRRSITVLEDRMFLITIHWMTGSMNKTPVSRSRHLQRMGCEKAWGVSVRRLDRVSMIRKVGVAQILKSFIGPKRVWTLTYSQQEAIEGFKEGGDIRSAF